VIDDDYAPYRKPSTSYDKSPLSHYHDNDLFDTGSNWVPDTWKPAAWLPDLPFLSGQQHHLPDGKRGRVLVTGGAGALGIPVVDRLLKEGFAVTLHDLRDPSPRDVHYIRKRNPDATKGGRLAFIKGDILARSHLSTLMKELTAPATKKGKKKPPAVEGSLGAGGGLVGVINLAGISRDIWCSSRVEDCEELNVKSTTHLFDTLAEATQKKSGQKPWFLHLSSLDVYDPSTKQIAISNTDELTSLGKTKLLAERELEKSYNKYMNDLLDGPNGMTSDDDDGIRTMILRPSTIYGSPADIQDRLVPALIQNALADLPVQILYGNAQVDFLHIDDALDGFIGAIERLMGKPEPADEVEEVKSTEEEVADRGTPSESTGFELTEDPAVPVKRDVPAAMQVGPMFEAYDLVSGYSSTPKQLLDMVMGLTQSRSPVQDHTSNLDPNIQVKLPLMSLEVPSTLRSKLGFTAAISLDQGIAGYVNTMRQEFTDWARDYLGAECPSSPLYGDPKVTHVADLRNKHLQRLVGCTANIGVNHEGWIHHMKCGDSTCAADNIKVPSFNWNQSIFTIIPYENADAIAEAQQLDEANAAANAKWGWAFGLLGTESRKEGAQNQPVRIQLEEKNTRKVMGFLRKDVPEGKTRYVKLRLFDHAEARDSETIVSVFEPKVRCVRGYLGTGC
jgi:nucleoside-diphosphate-sugar epimerase